MKTFKHRILGATAVAALLCTAGTANAVNLVFPDYDNLKHSRIAGTNFTAELAREYQDLSMYEFDEMYDYIDAETYAAKGMMAKSGRVPAPFNPENWDIDDARAMNDLKSARVQLVSAMQQGAPKIAPDLAANAQTKYDCWVEQEEEGWQEDHIAACREGFQAAMNELAVAMKPEPVEDTSMQEEPAEDPVVSAEPMITIDSEVIYFDFDKATLTHQGQTTVDVLTERLAGMDDITINVEGHADRAGAADYNLKLAEERANAVRDALVLNGLNVVAVDTFSVESEGETEPAVETADGVREALNRRVEVIVRGTPQQALLNDNDDVASSE